MSGDIPTVGEYAAQVRGWAVFDREYRAYKGLPAVDPNVVFNFARVAAVWERLRYDIHTKGASPGDRARLVELTEALQPLATQLGLGTVDPDKFLPDDPARYLASQGDLNDWWRYSLYRPREW